MASWSTVEALVNGIPRKLSSGQLKPARSAVRRGRAGGGRRTGRLQLHGAARLVVLGDPLRRRTRAKRST